MKIKSLKMRNLGPFGEFDAKFSDRMNVWSSPDISDTMRRGYVSISNASGVL